MTDGPPRRPTRLAAGEETPNDETWRTMAGLLGRAWLARTETARSGGIALVGVRLVDRGAPSGPPAPASGGPRPFSLPLARPGPHDPVGGVASFVVEVANAHTPAATPNDTARVRATWGRIHRGVHCRGGLHAHVSHPPCNRPPDGPADGGF